ncbi:hypothetical protein SAMN05421820_10460 [Pedobacter steynii]|uniref:Uncharacterized protein n=1 Tax=Pedobacter steynii TaxID=430522 RepID=A0A1G9U5L8_9SPHI|nr:hypothetical protein [Pedobacter steynii]NQX40656.1 hypothetical protein [Pedobacter steynii]SDM54934.1 hypothetical protein SAMN05421820_10460 [Pedobacter steynii]
MRPLVIKKSWKSLPLEVANVLLFLGPAIVVLYFYETNVIVFILLLIYMLFVMVIGVYVMVYLRRPNVLILTDEGLKLDDKAFYEWQDLESYKILEETVRNKTAEGDVVNTTYTLVITLKNGNLLRVSTAQLNKRPKQIIAAFDERKQALGLL